MIALIIALLPAFLFLLFLYIQAKSKRSGFQAKRRKRRKHRHSTPYREKFLAMLQGDIATAQRLIEHEKRLNPGQSEQWYWEKATYRLERDRR